MVVKRADAGNSKPRRPPASTPEAREKQLQALAVDLAERQLIDGTASAQVLTYYLKGSSMREKLELENLRKENLLKEAKIAESRSGSNMEKLLTNAMEAFTEYQGRQVVEEDDDR